MFHEQHVRDACAGDGCLLRSWLLELMASGTQAIGLAVAVHARFGRKLFADNTRNAWNRLMETA